MKNFFKIAVNSLVCAALLATSMLGVSAAATNIAPQAKVTVDSVSTEYPAFTADGVNDGSYSTRWQTNAQVADGVTAWVALDFGKEYTITKVTIDWETARAAEDGYVLQSSTDGKNWTDIDAEFAARVENTGAGEDGTATRYTDVATIASVKTQYLRVLCSKVAEDKYKNPSIWEIEVIGEAATEDKTDSTTSTEDKTDSTTSTEDKTDSTTSTEDKTDSTTSTEDKTDSTTSTEDKTDSTTSTEDKTDSTTSTEDTKTDDAEKNPDGGVESIALFVVIALASVVALTASCKARRA